MDKPAEQGTTGRRDILRAFLSGLAIGVGVGVAAGRRMLCPGRPPSVTVRRWSSKTYTFEAAVVYDKGTGQVLAAYEPPTLTYLGNLSDGQVDAARYAGVTFIRDRGR